MHRKCYKAQGQAIDHKNDPDRKGLFILIKLPPSVMLCYVNVVPVESN